MRFPRRRTAAAASVIALAAAGLAQPQVAHSSSHRPTPASSHRDSSRSVTLLTGDTVQLGPTGQPEIRTRRNGISYAVQKVANHLYVVPSDAAALLSQGKLDHRLFDVSALLTAGLDDQQSKEVRLLVEYSQPTGRLRSINASPTRFAKTDAAAGWANLVKGQRLAGSVRKIWLDGKRELSLDKSVPQIGAPEAWKAGLTGKGVKVAVLDSGIDATHPDLAGKVIATQNFTQDPAGDQFGHGTHVASTIAGSGAASGGRYRGVAPDAELLDGKVCASTCFDSDILAGMEWAVAQGADVVNLSLGGTDTPEIDPLEEAVNRLSSQALFVVASGNWPYCTSPRYGVSSPATADAALAVAAVDKADAFADFSCTGPRLGDHAIKPDITAPGVDIVAARAKDGVIGEPVDENYTKLSGTSMATPHVTGSAAILAQQHPDWTPAGLKAALMGSAKTNPDQTLFQQGAGRVDVGTATRQSVAPLEGSISYPVQTWPHTDDELVNRTITYQNSGTADVDLHLVAQSNDPDGRPAGTFTLGQSSVRVPAGGTAKVTVTANTKLDGPNGYYAGRVIATAGTTHLTTVLSVEREAESYNLTIRHLDRQGGPIQPVETVVASHDDSEAFDFAYDPVSVVRLPKGKYVLDSYIRLPTSDDRKDRAFLAMPELDLSKDTTVTFDAAQAKPVKVAPPRADAAPYSIELGFARGTQLSFAYLTGTSFDGLATAQVGPAVAGTDFASTLLTQWCRPGEPMGCDDASPYHYLLQWFVPGELYTGFDKAVRPQDLAVVKTDYAASSANDRMEMGRFASPLAELPEQPVGGFSLFPKLPSESTLYLQAKGIRWSTRYREIIVDPDSGNWGDGTEFRASPRTYRAGSTSVEHWNKGVFGPGFPATDQRLSDPDRKPWAGRDGDHLHTDLPLFTDGFGHAGFSPTDEARTTLTQDGKVIAEATETAGVLTADLPAGAAQYRLEAEAKRNSQNGPTSEVSAVWTFRSGRTAVDSALPLSAVRFSPALDDHNRAKPGWVPVSVQRQPGSAAQPARTLAVQVSYDEGKSWQPAPVRRHGAAWQVKVTPPPGTAYVSLRAQSADRAGNTIDQTVVKAFAVSS
ncbi:subtilisin family serine protease [Kribbella voronezhensis]|uniref:Subtilisin family serine protease n=1 Tax=Kribbella voronezhensis TaxID=2512212 RepID=A0A4R7T9X7_9ACTN|nr:S8 family serine peptidase [Kribbella voronezhensis]TDU88705.1 subtilisin family serine protease [Kribbella voronezhensis]